MVIGRFAYIIHTARVRQLTRQGCIAISWLDCFAAATFGVNLRNEVIGNTHT
ncbi:hypothetical protein QWZ13_18075 [Reinekea marina]|uniref:hypothetical protein n=1 Tax=Reinekea marina TaxID=1310421 RepID=UPI0025B46E76|nr:hypothetical protein [Reinekea marina]MDN3650818.1 hypothetical protein [Reinekea marina]